MKKSNQHYPEGNAFSGSVREFVELMTHQGIPQMTKPGRWIIGQMLYLKVTGRKSGEIRKDGEVAFSNTPY